MKVERIYIQKVLDHIEAHLRDDRPGVLDNATLARVAGYSPFHFLRVFQKHIGLTPADYIRKRRISEIVKHMEDGSRPMSDIAFEYGFNSKENFTRAFKKEHCILPTEFRAAGCSLRLYEPFEFDRAFLHPQISMVYLEAFSLVAYPCNEDSPPNFWNRYNAEKRSLRLSGGTVTEDFGAMRWNAQKGQLDYFIGIRAEEANGDTTETVHLDIADGLYAVFETPPATSHDFVATIRRTWEWIYGEWLPQSGYRRATGFELECYVESSRNYSERIYVPLIKSQER